MSAIYDGFYLLDHHRNRDKTSGPAGEYDTRPWYTTRNRCHHGHDRPHLIVIHDPETLEDFIAPYDEAERVARYGATTTRASWHDSIDADSIIPMLPPEFTAWHVRGFNRCGIGLEVGALATSWDRAPAAWLEGVMANTARRVLEHMAAFDIPPVLLFEPGRRYTEPLDPAGFGLISHHALDPTRRTDPGFTFPWTDLLDRLEDPMVTRDTKVAPNPILAGDFAEMRDEGVFSQYTDPGKILITDELGAFLSRYTRQVLDPTVRTAKAEAIAAAKAAIAASNTTQWSKMVDWVREHVKVSIAAAFAAGAGAAQVDYDELVREIGRVLAGG